MSDDPQSRDISDAILTRRFELDDGHVDIHVWAPVDDGKDYPRCDYQIIGLGDDKIRVGTGLDAIGAVNEALKLIAIIFYNSREWREGRLTFNGMRDLDLPYLPGQRPLEGGLGPAHLLHMSSWMAVVSMPDLPMPYLAWADWNLPTHIRSLEGVLTDIATSPEDARSLLEDIIDGLKEQKRYYDRICCDAGLPSSPEGLR